MPCGDRDSSSLAVTLEDIRQFRQQGSRCPGHPEYRWTAGVEMTTGPLGQGIASSVGMAISSKWYASTFNKPDFDLFNYDVYALCGDGCLQEGVSHEAASLAAHLKLDNLCWIWDNNEITIEGNTSLSISEDIATRFMAYGWNVLRVSDANDVSALTRSLKSFKTETQRPTLIVVDSHIGWGSPKKQDTAAAHGAPLGEAEVAATKEVYGWQADKFAVPPAAQSHFQSQMASHGGAARQEWDALLVRYSETFPEEYEMLQHIQKGTLPADWDKSCKEFAPDSKGLATRQSSSTCLNMVAENIPWMVGGSADLGPSCLTTIKSSGDFMHASSNRGSYQGRNLHFGIREHAMGSIMNGMAVSGLRPFGSTFFVFSDYMKPTIRMSAIMEVPCIWIFTHDSIGVGEDGPTHQPVEQLSALRSVPGLLTFRPGDANEALEMWKYVATMVDEPAALVLSRQAMPTLDRTIYAPAVGLTRGGYVLADYQEDPEVILMASGSEVSLMLEAHEILVAEGVRVRSVSMPCLELFKQQGAEYIEGVLPNSCRARVSIEAATTDPWSCLVGLDGEHVGMNSFGFSAPGKRLQQEMGFTVEKVTAAAKRTMRRQRRPVDSVKDVLQDLKCRGSLHRGEERTQFYA